jgi:hypothetical protein
MNAPRLAAAFALATAVLSLPAFAPRKGPPRSLEYPSPMVREEQAVIVDGLTEVWQLRWAAKPKPMCEPSDVSLTCPCTGFAYGEGGTLDLLRMQNGIEFDRLPLAPLFDERFGSKDSVAIVQRWRADTGKDFDLAMREDFPAIVAKRPTTQVMHLADYDHDGLSSEFYFQTEALPCGKSLGIVLGVSKTDPRLHAFGTASNPGKPLYMQKENWEALRDASGPIEVLDWACGDHGSDTQTTLRLRWTPNGIDGSRRTSACDPDGRPGILTGEDPL